MRRLWVVLFLAVWIGFQAHPVQGRDLSTQLQTPVRQAVKTRQNTQKAADKWAEEKSNLEAEFRMLQKENEALELKHRELTEKVSGGREKVASLERQIQQINRISDELAPFLNDIMVRYAEHGRQDLPFLPEERHHRIQNLRDMLKDESVTVAEKYRRLMEALLIEAEYGNTVEVYREKIDLNGARLLADIFRLGKLSLFCRSLDHQITGFYDPPNRKWQPFPARYNPAVDSAIEIGSKRRAVDLISLPIGKVLVK